MNRPWDASSWRARGPKHEARSIPPPIPGLPTPVALHQRHAESRLWQEGGVRLATRSRFTAFRRSAPTLPDQRYAIFDIPDAEGRCRGSKGAAKPK